MPETVSRAGRSRRRIGRCLFKEPPKRSLKRFGRALEGEHNTGRKRLSMSSATLVSVQEYLATSYRPDRDFVDGELQERNLGELEHALLQSAILAWFWAKQREWNVLPIVEQRVQVAATRFRIPDVSVLRADQPREPIITTPPLILIEVLSKDDTLRSMRERVDDYLK